MRSFAVLVGAVLVIGGLAACRGSGEDGDPTALCAPPKELTSFDDMRAFAEASEKNAPKAIADKVGVVADAARAAADKKDQSLLYADTDAIAAVADVAQYCLDGGYAVTSRAGDPGAAVTDLRTLTVPSQTSTPTDAATQTAQVSKAAKYLNTYIPPSCNKLWCR
jgi:hypothetical protein